MCKAAYSLTDILLLESLIVVRESYFYLIYVTTYSFWGTLLSSMVLQIIDKSCIWTVKNNGTGHF